MTCLNQSRKKSEAYICKRYNSSKLACKVIIKAKYYILIFPKERKLEIKTSRFIKVKTNEEESINIPIHQTVEMLFLSQITNRKGIPPSFSRRRKWNNLEKEAFLALRPHLLSCTHLSEVTTASGCR